MPVVGMIGAFILLAAVVGLAGSFVIFVVLPGAAIALVIWVVWLIVHYAKEANEQEKAALLKIEAERRQQEEQRALEHQQQEDARAEEAREREREATYDHYMLLLGKRLGNVYHSLLPVGEAPFLVPLHAIPLANDIVARMSDLAWEEDYVEYGVGSQLRTKQRVGAESVGSPEKPVWPRDYKGPDAHKIYLPQSMWPLFEMLVPYQPFKELNRCAHHWCLGKTRRGKTTFLRHLIKYDLEEVAKGNCSLVVIDSKPEGLVHEMRTLKGFGPGGKLDGRLILIDSDVAFPLNPFTMKDKNLARAFISYMVATDTTPLQTGALSFLVDAALQSRDKSLATLLKYIRLERNKLPDEIGGFDDELQDWFRKTRPGIGAITTSGVEQRLANFMREHRGSPIFKNLTADSWGLDLYKELHDGGKVLLVDTNHLKNGADGTALMGRLFIALLENLAARRQRAAKPIWVVIDEASDYLGKSDASFVQILIKAAGAKVGMTVAYQTKGLIDSTVEKALENAEIHSTCEQRGTVLLEVEERPLPPLPVSRLEFTEEPQMHPDDYKKLREWLSFAYPYKQTPPKEEGKQPLTQKF